MVKIAVSGARGRMGQGIITLAKKDPGLEIVCAFERSNHPDLGKTIDGLLITDARSDLKNCDCLIDFSAPSAIAENITSAVRFQKSMVIGTTGLDTEQYSMIEEASQNIPIICSPNMSIGVNLLFRLVQQTGKILRGYKINIEEAHHIHKKDAPSGTAKKIAQILNGEGFLIKQEEIKSIREGEIIGDHKVIFEGSTDKLTLAHSAKTLYIFAQGALRAAKWIVGKKPRLYSMNDVLFT